MQKLHPKTESIWGGIVGDYLGYQDTWIWNAALPLFLFVVMFVFMLMLEKAIITHGKDPVSNHSIGGFKAFAAVFATLALFLIALKFLFGTFMQHIEKLTK